jgi:hypothetical protein
MLAIHGLNPRPALAYDLFLMSVTRVLSIFHIFKYRRKVTNRGKMDVLSKPLKRRIRMGYTCITGIKLMFVT